MLKISKISSQPLLNKIKLCYHNIDFEENMTKFLNKRKIFSFVALVCISAIAIFSGYFLGNLIVSKNFPMNNYQNIDVTTLRDNINSISYSTTSPTDLDGAIVFQIAEKVQRESRNYEIIGIGEIQTSLGVKQSSHSVDRRNGDDLYLAFTTYSSVVKVSKQCNYNIGGDIRMYEGTPKDTTTTNVDWSDKYDEFTWEEYYQTFGKYANNNCCYIVSTKTYLDCSKVEKDGDLYKCTIELDPTLASISYSKQIGVNMGIDSNTVKFNKISLTYWIDKDYKFIKQEKFESYTVQYFGVKLTLDATIETNFNIN